VTVEQFKKFRDARPFRPFAIHAADGREFIIGHPENAVLSRSGRTFTVENRDGLSEVLDMLLVVSLRPLTEMEHRLHRLRRT
jgi:hypothetical protein